MNTLQSEGVIQIAYLDKNLIPDSAIPVDSIIANLGYDGFESFILHHKALPQENVPIHFAYIPYREDNLDSDLYTIRIVTKVLRLRTRGRRSNDFKQSQKSKLLLLKEPFLNELSKQVRSSGILNEKFD